MLKKLWPEMGWGFASLMIFVAFSEMASAQDRNKGAALPDIQEIQKLEEDAKNLGNWDDQYILLDQATDNVFNQQGWNSESDLYARDLMRQVGRVSPWNPKEREKIFLDSLQQRYTLTEDQRTTLNGDMQREMMMVAMKNFKSTLPVAMEIIKTRASNQPFTPEQVQRWSKALKPVIEDSMGAVDRVVSNLDRSMSESQRGMLQADMQAFRKRHTDVSKMMDRWQAGQWNPTDWGLQNDPVHQEAIVRYNAEQAEKDAAVAREQEIAKNSNAWDLYVRRFCEQYDCSNAQRTQAEAILKKCRKEAMDYLAARKDQIDQLNKQSETAAGPEGKQKAAQGLEKVMTPVGDIFNRMKMQLAGLLTTEQRVKYGTPTPTKSAPRATVIAQPAAPPTPSPAPAKPRPSRASRSRLKDSAADD